MEKTIQPTAIDASATAEQLRAFVNQSHELNRVIASHPNADSQALDDMADFYGGDSAHKDVEVQKLCVQHPNVSYSRLVSLGRKFPAELLKNPALSKFIADNDRFHLDVPHVLSTPGCPENLLTIAANSGDKESMVYLLLNPDLPDSVRSVASGDRSFNEAIKRLRRFIADTEDEKERQYLEIYANTSRPFCIPRFCLLDKANPAHRLEDQLLCGFPYTSAKWPWPVGGNGEYMQPIAQINLERAGLLLEEDLGVGLLQIWGGVGEGFGVHTTRVIPTVDVNDAPDDFYPEPAIWLKTGFNGDLEFKDCTVNGFFSDEFLPFRPEQCRVEWVNMGRMLYPSTYMRISNPLTLDDPEGVIKYWDVDGSVLEDLDEKLEELDLPTALTHGAKPLFQLGGYGDGLGNTWSEDHGSLLLWHSIEDFMKVTVAVYFKRSSSGEVEFSLVSNCDN